MTLYSNLRRSYPIEAPSGTPGSAGAAGADGTDGTSVIFSNNPATAVATTTTNYEVFTGMTTTVTDLTATEGDGLRILTTIEVPPTYTTQAYAEKSLKLTIDGTDVGEIEVVAGVQVCQYDTLVIVDDAGDLYVESNIRYTTSLYNTEEITKTTTISPADITSFVVDVRGDSVAVGDLKCKHLTIIQMAKS